MKSQTTSPKKDPKFFTPHFGTTLRSLRIQAGYQSLDAAIRAMEKIDPSSASKDSKKSISKAMLNLLERGKIGAVRPELFDLLSRLYNTPYHSLCKEWLDERYSLALSPAPNSKIRAEEKDSKIFLANPEIVEENPPITVVPIDYLEEQQGLLPKGSKVAIAAIRFLDDNRFFSMVSSNLKRGIKYTYLLPENKFFLYQSFLSRVDAEHPQLAGKLDGKLTKFFPLPSFEFPANFALHQYPSGELKGFIGLLRDDEVCFFQVADPQLCWRMLEGYQWSILAAKDEKIRKQWLELQITNGHPKMESSRHDGFLGEL